MRKTRGSTKYQSALEAAGFRSVSHLARESGLTNSQTHYRLDAGWSPDRIKSGETLKRRPVKRTKHQADLEVAGFESIAALAEACDLSSYRVKTLLNDGWTPARVMREGVPWTGFEKKYEYRGERYSSLAEMGKVLGLAGGNVIRKFMKEGMTLEAATDRAVYNVKNPGNWVRAGDINCVPVTVEGVQYRSVRDAFKELGVPRVSVKGRDPAEVIQEKLNEKRAQEKRRDKGKFLAARDRAEIRREKLTRASAELASKSRLWGHYTPVRWCSDCGAFEADYFLGEYWILGFHDRAEASGDLRLPESDVCNSCLDERKKRRKKQDRGRHVHRARKHGVDYEHGITAKAVAEQYNYTCQECLIEVEPHPGGWLDAGWTVGHKIPLSAGGSHTWDNVQCECQKCNTAKGDTVYDVYVEDSNVPIQPQAVGN